MIKGSQGAREEEGTPVFQETCFYVSEKILLTGNFTVSAKTQKPAKSLQPSAL